MSLRFVKGLTMTVMLSAAIMQLQHFALLKKKKKKKPRGCDTEQWGVQIWHEGMQAFEILFCSGNCSLRVLHPLMLFSPWCEICVRTSYTQIRLCIVLPTPFGNDFTSGRRKHYSRNEHLWIHEMCFLVKRNMIPESVYLCVYNTGVRPLCRGFGAQADLIIQHPFLSQHITHLHQQIWWVNRTELLSLYPSDGFDSDFIGWKIPYSTFTRQFWVHLLSNV